MLYLLPTDHEHYIVTSSYLYPTLNCNALWQCLLYSLHTSPHATTQAPSRHHWNPHMPPLEPPHTTTRTLTHHHSNPHLPPLKLPLCHHFNPHYTTTQGPGALNLETKIGPYGPNGMSLTKMTITMMFLRSIKVMSWGVGHQPHHPFNVDRIILKESREVFHFFNESMW